VSGKTAAEVPGHVSLGPFKDLAEKVAAAIGAGHVDVSPVSRPSGSSRSGWLVETAGPPRAVLFARIDSGTSGLSGTMYSLAREATILTAVRSVGLPVPRIHGVIRQPFGLVMELIDGRSDLGEDIPLEDRVAVATEYLHHLNRLHCADADTLLSCEIQGSGTVGQAVRAEFSRWSGDPPSGPLEDAIRAWLLDRMPADDRPPRLLHGDPGGGNLFRRDATLVAILDWECAHLGEPLEDRAAVECRALGREAEVWHRALAATAELCDPLDPARVVFCGVLWLYTTTVAMGRALRAPIPPARRQAFEERTLENWLICIDQIDHLEGPNRLPRRLVDPAATTWAAERRSLRDARALLADPVSPRARRTG
jgi:aminoglycoside phosphotransferase (APT) family kinase protein